MIGAAVMSPLLDAFGLSIVLYVCAGVALAGTLVTVFFVVETAGKSLEQLTEEEETAKRERSARIQ